LASSFVLFSTGAAAQSQPSTEQRSNAPAGLGSAPGVPARQSGTGRDQFIAPVMGIQIQDDGLNLPPVAAEEDQPAKPPAKPAAETKEPEARSTGK
jgi:hypothetical protein